MSLRTRTIRRLAALAVGAVSVIAIGSSTAGAYQPRVPSSLYGINAPELVLRTWTDPSGTDAHLAAIQKSGVSWVRADATWGQVEPVLPVAGVHVYDWSFYDGWVEKLAEHHLSWLAMPSGAPVWARSLQSTLDGCAGRSAPDPTFAPDYGSFVKALVARYGRGGQFWRDHPTLPVMPVTTVELWNEPNWAGFWCRHPDPESYAPFAEAGADGAHAADPRVTVSAGGLVTTRSDIVNGGTTYGMATDDYLERMLAAKPALATKLDAVALHLYDQDPDVDLSLVGWISHRMKELGLTKQQILISEFGWHTKGGTDSVPITTSAANYHALVGQLSRTDCNLLGMAPYNWLSPQVNEGDPEDWFGLANSDATLNPAGKAYASEVGTYLGTGSAPAPRETIHLCGEAAPDQDNDGVPDEDDDYPLDPAHSTGSGETPPADPDAPKAPVRAPRVPSDFFGTYVRQMPYQADLRKAYYDSMSAAKLGSVRDSVLWSLAEPTAPGDSPKFAWSETEPRVLGLARRGIKVEPSFVSKPSWASGTPAQTDDQFAAFLAAYAKHYGAGGEFWAANGNLDPKLAVSDFEIWSNANNVDGSWDGTASAAEYAATYVKARAALHAADPTARAIVPVLAGGSAGSASDFIRAMVAAQPSLRGQIDGVYVQALQAKSPGVVTNLAAQTRAALTATGNANATLRVGMGWYTKSPGAVTEDERADLLSTTADQLARSNCGIDGVYADAWTMNEANASSLWDWIGIANPSDGSLKPSGQAYSGVAKSFLGFGTKEAERATVHTCGSSTPDSDGDGTVDPNDDAPLDPKVTDDTPPKIKIKGPRKHGKSVLFKLGATDRSGLEGFECRLDNKAWTPCTRSHKVTSPPRGKHTLRVRVSDKLGNTGTASRRWRVKQHR